MSDYTLYPLILNSSSSMGNGVFRYTFPVGSVAFRSAKVAVASISMYYSWFNITSAYGNNSFQVIFPTSTGTTTITINIPNGFYAVSDLNAYLQAQFISNGLYLVNASGNFVYYLELVENASSYSVQENSYPVPTSLPAGYSNPASMTFPASASTPQLVVLNNAFRNVIGFNPGTYPPVAQSTNYSDKSAFTPQVSPVESVVLACSLLNNRWSNPPTLLYSFSPASVSFGNLIDSSPHQFSFIDIQEGNYNFFDIQFLDQSLNPLQLNDTNLVVQLLIQSK